MKTATLELKVPESCDSCLNRECACMRPDVSRGGSECKEQLESYNRQNVHAIAKEVEEKNRKHRMQIDFSRSSMKDRLKATEFVVEANSYEQLALWRSYHRDNDWIEIASGWLETVGQLDKRPVCVSLGWAIINSKPVLFYDATSQVVDHEMIEKWFKKNCWPKYDNDTRRAHCDAMNFGHCLSHCKKESDDEHS